MTAGCVANVSRCRVCSRGSISVHVTQGSSGCFFPPNPIAAVQRSGKRDMVDIVIPILRQGTRGQSWPLISTQRRELIGRRTIQARCRFRKQACVRFPALLSQSCQSVPGPGEDGNRYPLCLGRNHLLDVDNGWTTMSASNGCRVADHVSFDQATASASAGRRMGAA